MTRILIIDDDFSTTELLESILNRYGFIVSTANFVSEGIELVKEVNPDLVIVDLIMPEIDGWQITHRIRSFSKVPILVLSVIDTPKDIARVLDEGADEYMTKPIQPNLLIARINTLTRRAKAEKEAAISKKFINI